MDIIENKEGESEEEPSGDSNTDNESEEYTDKARSNAQIIVGMELTLIILTLYLLFTDSWGLAGLSLVAFVGLVLIDRRYYPEMTIGEMLEVEEAKKGYKETLEQAEADAEKATRRNTQSEPQIQNRELQQQVEDKKAEGWTVDEIDNANDRVIMLGTEGGSVGGHAVTGVLTGLWTFGAGNVVYDKLSKKRNRERIVLRVDEDADGMPMEPEADRDNMALLKDLDELREEGIISEAEFENKKEELLDDI